MNMQAVVIRSILILAMSLGVGVVALSRSHPQPQVAHVPAAAANEPVTLPTISVRPSAADIAAALESQDDFAAAAYIQDAALLDYQARNRTRLPGLHLEMPYYSFGKTLTRVSKD